MRIKREKLGDQGLLLHGAGTCGRGNAEQLELALMEQGLSREEAAERIFAVVSKGVLRADRECDLYKQRYAKEPALFPWI